jgi:hypothetical protein
MMGQYHTSANAQNLSSSFLDEPARQVPVSGSFDVVVAGGGPAGVCAALAAARRGVSVLLLEAEGCLGGIMTSGLMSNIIDAANKGGILKEILNGLQEMGMTASNDCVDPEAVKYLFEKKLLDTGVRIRLHSRVVSAVVSDDHRLGAVITESSSGREAWQGKVFIDATGNGDLGALAGCHHEIGDAQGRLQAMSLCALVYGVNASKVQDLTLRTDDTGKHNLHNLLQRAGKTPSYDKPTLFALNEHGFLLMSNHQYQTAPNDADAITEATMAARAELWEQLAALRQAEPRLATLRLGATAATIGVREGRRINALYQLTVNDLVNGQKQPDPVCKATFSVDIHGAIPGNNGYTSHGLETKPYDIPLRSLIAKDVSGLLLAGRCIGGDFYAHASYRVIGNAMPIGEAAGICAALAARNDVLPHQITYPEFLEAGGNPHPLS